MHRQSKGWQGRLRELWRDEDATTALEYALALALVAVSSIVAYQILGRSTAESAAGSNLRLGQAGDDPGLHHGGYGPPSANSGGGGGPL